MQRGDKSLILTPLRCSAEQTQDSKRIENNFSTLGNTCISRSNILELATSGNTGRSSTNAVRTSNSILHLPQHGSWISDQNKTYSVPTQCPFQLRPATE